MIFPDIVENFPNSVAVIDASSNKSITYRQLSDYSTKLAHYLNKHLSKGDRFATLQKNNIHAFVTLMTSIRSSFRVVPINWHLKQEEAKHIIKNSQSLGLIVSSDFKEIAYELSTEFDFKFKMFDDFPIKNFSSLYDSILFEPTTPSNTDEFAFPMFYSSGTAGAPKGILNPLTPIPIYDNSIYDTVKEMYGYDANAVIYSPCPLYHSTPITALNLVLNSGGCCIVSDSFDPEKTLEYIEKYKITHMVMVPTHFVRLLKLDEKIRNRYDVSSLKFVIHGGANCPITIKEQMVEWWGNIFYEFYGSTESLYFVTMTPEDYTDHKGSVGKVISQYGDISIVNDDGIELPRGEVGHIVVSNSYRTISYHNSNDSLFVTKNGKLGIGDIGYMDDEDYLYVTGRTSDIINTGGVKIYPKEAEDILITHHNVQDVAVIGIPDIELGEKAIAVVQLVIGTEPSTSLKNELITFCKERLSSFKCPKEVYFANDLPRLPSGKLLKRELLNRHYDD
jgi:fatty-acyl-CoA synthase